MATAGKIVDRLNPLGIARQRLIGRDQRRRIAETGAPGEGGGLVRFGQVADLVADRPVLAIAVGRPVIGVAGYALGLGGRGRVEFALAAVLRKITARGEVARTLALATARAPRARFRMPFIDVLPHVRANGTPTTAPGVPKRK